MNVAHGQGELLAQLNPIGTTAQLLFGADKLRAEITLILAVNRNASNQTVQLFHDDDGTTYSAATEIIRKSVANGSEILFQAQHPGSGIIIKPSGNLGLQVGVANDITVSVYGITETLADRVRGIQ